jgi:hypothetical protein
MGLLVAAGSVRWWSVEFEPWGGRSPARSYNPLSASRQILPETLCYLQRCAIAYGFGVLAGLWDRRRRRIAVPYGSRYRELGGSPGMAATTGLLVGLHGVDAGRSDFLAAGQCRVCRGPPSFDAKTNHTRTIDCAHRDGIVVRWLPLRIWEPLSLNRGGTWGIGRVVRRLCRLPSAHWPGEGLGRQG